MPKTLNTILTAAIVLCIFALLLYAYMATQRLDEVKEDAVVSTIDKHINDGKARLESLEAEEELEDDGGSEDEEFEEFIEEDEDDFDEKTIEEVSPPEPEKLSAFMVIAGSFGSRENAENKVRELEKMGIVAEIVHLHNSELHAICVARSDTEVEANDEKEALKEKYKLKTYVYKSPQE